MKYLKKVADDEHFNTTTESPEKFTEDDLELFQTEKRSMLGFKNLLRHIANRASIFIKEIKEEGIEKIFTDKIHYNFLDNLNKMMEKFMNPDEEIKEVILDNKNHYIASYNTLSSLHKYLASTSTQELDDSILIELLEKVKILFTELDADYDIS